MLELNTEEARSEEFILNFEMEVWFDNPKAYEILMEGEARLQKWIKQIIAEATFNRG